MEIQEVEEIFEVTIVGKNEGDISSAKAIDMATEHVELITGETARFLGFDRKRNDKVVVRLGVW